MLFEFDLIAAYGFYQCCLLKERLTSFKGNVLSFIAFIMEPGLFFRSL